MTLILQLALAIDYAVILCNRFAEEKQHSEPRQAMIDALTKGIPEISSSSLTTIGGLIAMAFMQFGLGSDLGRVLIQKKGDKNGEDKLHIFAKIRLTARKGLSLAEALSHMVDVPIDFIWMETGRTPWHYTKVRFTLTAEEIAQLAGVTLAKD